MDTADELWQAYDEHGDPTGTGITKQEAYSGVLHGAAHVWVWRRAADGTIEVLLQFRAPGKRTWPERYDTSAAGHIDVGELPLMTARREAREEIGLDATEERFRLSGMHRCHVIADSGHTENEMRFLYTIGVAEDIAFTMTDGEVTKVLWKPLDQLVQEVAHDEQTQRYVPHGEAYWAMTAEAVRAHAAVQA